MKEAYQRGRGALEIIEEAFHLLRLASLPTLLAYYIGAVPFVLGVLYFWSDMSRSAFADERLALETVGLAALFFWLKTWQAIFARQLRAQIVGHTPQSLSLRRAGQIAVIQAILQPLGLFLIPIALLLLFPIAWVYGFYQSVTALAGLEEQNFKSVVRNGLKQAALWPVQNNYVIFLFSAFGLFVFLNLLSGAVMIPYLLSMLLGIQSVFVQSPSTFLNTTFFAAICGLTWLCVDPAVKAVYVLRCFYGESRRTGEDLKAELRFVTAPVQSAVAISLLCGVVFFASSVSMRAAETSPATTMKPAELDRAIDQVMQQPEYTWRLPREQSIQQHPKSKVGSLIQSGVHTVEGWIKAAGRAIDKFIKWLSPKSGPGSGNGGFQLDWLFSVKGLIFLLVLIIAGLLLLLLVRLWKQRHDAEVPQLTAQGLTPVPDLAQEDVAADQLPTDGWIIMARDFLARGELRLALRAFYLASLAHLAQRNLVTIARYKSNRDYERELSRRAHALPEVMSTFTENVSIFDRIWYGMHEVNGAMIEHFQRNVEKIKTA